MDLVESTPCGGPKWSENPGFGLCCDLVALRVGEQLLDVETRDLTGELAEHREVVPEHGAPGVGRRPFLRRLEGGGGLLLFFKGIGSANFTNVPGLR